MFDALSDRFDGIFTRLRSRGRLNEKDVDEVAREIRLALLEADVNVKVVKGFIARVKERANGADVQKSLSPRAAGHQDRARGAREHARRRHRQARDEPEAADRRHARRPAGLREDDRRRQAGPPC